MYTIEEIAKMLRVSVPTVRRLIEDGELRANKVRGQWRISKEAYEEYLRQSQQR